MSLDRRLTPARPDLAARHLEGRVEAAAAELHQVGGSAHPGGGRPLVGMGAELVAELIGRARPAR